MEQTPHVLHDEQLAALEAGREALLKRAINILLDDQRVVATWLYGSLGKGTADAWSDIDLWVVVADGRIEEIRETRHEYVTALREPLLVVDAPQNAPAGGAFLSVLYGGEAGSHHVDWTWQRQSDAQVPTYARILFDRVGLPQAVQPKPPTEQERVSRAKGQTTYFWMMVPVVAKYIGRGRLWEAIGLLNMLRYTLDEIAGLTGQADNSPLYPANDTLSPPAEPADQMSLLRELCDEMNRLMSKEPALTEAASPEARKQVKQHLDLVLGLITEGS